MSELKKDNSGNAQLVKGDTVKKQTGSCLSKLLIILLVIVAIVSCIFMALNMVKNSYYKKFTDGFDGLSNGKFDVNKAVINTDISNTIGAGMTSEENVVKITTVNGKNVYENIPFSVVEKDVINNYRKASENIVSQSDIYNYVFIGNDSYNNSSVSNGVVSADVIIIVSYNSRSDKSIYYTLDSQSFVYVSNIDKVTTLSDVYSIGGEMLVCKAIQENYSISINGFVSIGVDSCAKSIDEFGGITLSGIDVDKLNAAIDSFDAKFGTTTSHVSADTNGKVKLNGNQTAAYLRSYNGLSRFDVTQEVIKATVVASMSKGAFGVKSFADDFADNIYMGSSKKDFNVLCNSIVNSSNSSTSKFVNAVNATYPFIYIKNHYMAHWLDNGSVRDRLIEIIY